jgi:2-oxoglutarate ferredoxin oxidoreductase subunit beta
MTDTKTLTKKDFQSDQEVRWCPGCGDYAILSCVQGIMGGLGIPKEEIVFVSGIGCSSRFPYYMNTYGFHSIHGRAPAIATGIKTANPDLSVWLVTGDGDGLSIGGNHMAHILRRNVDVKILLFNNEIYGLTKGQYSPTSPRGLRTKSSPMGSVDAPFNPLSFALGSGATFVARTVDTNLKHMQQVLAAAAQHKGSAFVEIYQNCVIFNDGAFEDVAAKAVRDDKMIDLRPGEPMVYGKEHDKGLRFEGLEVVRCSADEADEWKVDTGSPTPGFMMAQLDRSPDMPRPLGIFREATTDAYEDLVQAQVQRSIESKGEGQLHDLLYAGDLWTVEG